MKLTNSQLELLREVKGDSQVVSESYKPAQRLVDLGLCEWQKIGISEYLAITDAGRAALEQK